MYSTLLKQFLNLYSDNRKSKIANLKWLGPSLIAFVLVVAVAVVDAQQTKKLHRIGVLSSGDAASESARSQGIRLALRELGYVEGQNIAIEYRYAEGKRESAAKFAAELVRLNVAIIVVSGGTLWVRAAKSATQTIPIVMTGAGLDPVAAGLVESLARPGGNVTGITTQFTREVGGKRLELLKEAAPKVARVAVLYDPTAPGTSREIKDVLPAAAHALGLTIQPWEVRGSDDLDTVLAELNKKLPDGLHVTGGPDMRANINALVSFALKSRLPSVFQTREAVDTGGLMSYGADRADSYRRVANYVDKILKGAKPADLPIELPTKFELAINLKTAKQIGLTIPSSVLARVDRVIK